MRKKLYGVTANVDFGEGKEYIAIQFFNDKKLAKKCFVALRSVAKNVYPLEYPYEFVQKKYCVFAKATANSPQFIIFVDDDQQIAKEMLHFFASELPHLEFELTQFNKSMITHEIKQGAFYA